LWGYDEDPAYFFGGELSYAWSDFSYYPLYDTATGNPLQPLPDAKTFFEKGGNSKDSESPYAAKVYGGFSRAFTDGRLDGGSFGFALGLTYRREFATPSKFKDQQVCLTPPGTAFIQCRKINTAAPYEAEGVVASAALKFQLPRYGFLPPLAFIVKPSYAFDLRRWGVEAPIYLFNDSEGKLLSGVKITCRGEGRTESGVVLEEECGAALFVGTKFKIGGAP
jgi:hypothetical protein